MAYIASEYVGGIGVHDPNIIAPLFSGGGTETMPISEVIVPEGLHVQAAQAGILMTNAKQKYDIAYAKYKNNPTSETFNAVVDARNDVIETQSLEKMLLINANTHNEELSEINMPSTNVYATSDGKSYNVVDSWIGVGLSKTVSDRLTSKAGMQLMDNNGNPLPYVKEPSTGLDMEYTRQIFNADYMKHISSSFQEEYNKWAVDAGGKYTGKQFNSAGEAEYKEYITSNLVQLQAYIENIPSFINGLSGGQLQTLHSSILTELRNNWVLSYNEKSGSLSGIFYDLNLPSKGVYANGERVFNMAHVSKDENGNTTYRDAVRVMSEEKKKNGKVEVKEEYFFVENGERKNITNQDDLNSLVALSDPLLLDTNDINSIYESGRQMLLGRYLGFDSNWKDEMDGYLNIFGDKSQSEENRSNATFYFNKNIYTLLRGAGIIKQDLTEEQIRNYKPEVLVNKFQTAGDTYQKAAFKKMMEVSAIAHVGLWTTEGTSVLSGKKFLSPTEATTKNGVDSLVGLGISNWSNYDVLYLGNETIGESVLKMASVPSDKIANLFGGNNSLVNTYMELKKAANDNLYNSKEGTYKASKLYEYDTYGKINIHQNAGKPFHEIGQGNGNFMWLKAAEGAATSHKNYISAITPGAAPSVTIHYIRDNVMVGLKTEDNYNYMNMDALKIITSQKGDVDIAKYTNPYAEAIASMSRDDFWRQNITVSYDEFNRVKGEDISFKVGKRNVPLASYALADKRDAFKGKVKEAISAYAKIQDQRIGWQTELEELNKTNKKNYTIESVAEHYVKSMKLSTRSRDPYYNLGKKIFEEMSSYEQIFGYFSSDAREFAVEKSIGSEYAYTREDALKLQEEIESSYKVSKGHLAAPSVSSSSPSGYYTQQSNAISSIADKIVDKEVKKRENEIYSQLKDKYHITEQDGEMFANVTIGDFCDKNEKKAQKIWDIQFVTISGGDVRVGFTMGLGLGTQRFSKEYSKYVNGLFSGQSTTPSGNKGAGF